MPTFVLDAFVRDIQDSNTNIVEGKANRMAVTILGAKTNWRFRILGEENFLIQIRNLEKVLE